jgi:branched-chain amino acid transport system substrate-binding protein
MARTSITRRSALAASAAVFGGRRARAAAPVKVGFIVTLSGPFAGSGDVMLKAANLYMKTRAPTVLSGREVSLVVRDDGGANPEVAKRLVQELVAREHVQILAGFQWTPNANAVASLLNQAQLPCVLTNAAGTDTTRLSPWFVRTSFTQWQNGLPLGKWAAAKGYKRAYVLVTDFSPGTDASSAFTAGFTGGGGTIVDTVRMPIQNPNFVPFLQAARDAKPDVVFAFHPGGSQVAPFIRAFAELDFPAAGVRLIGAQDITSDEELGHAGPGAAGIITAGNYSISDDRPANKAFLAAWRAEYGADPTPNFMATATWDGMHAICSAIGGDGGEPATLLAALSHFSTEDSPRGPIHIDPQTRDIVQNIYIREVRLVDGKPENIEFDMIPQVKDPWKELHPA